ncbi:MAG: DUF3775 domain-containing protein [Phenylobacterium sp.]|uniref:DUF3775 domain-containing protein n=1 Tax=Phenylobacterium sp. TaxID=1871053 RepID=UPI0011F9E52C|nr:DUF3775 domain-containing protein [Phenylobacterium sp.]TAJ69826.1 MAG: DUF3775 domain-containing protein [Phenylobacterium sp.]
MAVRDPVLVLSPETAFFIVLKAREFHAKVEPVDPDEGSNAADDRAVDVLQFQGDDAVVEELVSAIGPLNEDERMDLVALIWLGRGDYDFSQWAEAREAARGIDPSHALDRLLGSPLASDDLEEGLSLFGHSLGDYLNSGFVAARDELLTA